MYWNEEQTTLNYRKVGDSNWISADGYARIIPERDRVVHTVKLTGLDEDSEYEFLVTLDEEVIVVYPILNENPCHEMIIHWHTSTPLKEGGYSAPPNEPNTEEVTIKRYVPTNDTYIPNNRRSNQVAYPGIFKFKTLPKENITVVMGSDLHHGDTQIRVDQTFAVMKKIKSHNPDFWVVGGDIVHCDNREDRWFRWVNFWEAYRKHMAVNGRLIPLAIMYGNHDASTGSFAESYDFDNQILGDNFQVRPQFAHPNPNPYGVLDIGDDISLVLLDTEHSTEQVTGADPQTQFLSNALSERNDRKYIIPVMHRTPFGLWRENNRAQFFRFRDHWFPLFYEYEIPVMFSFHEHITFFSETIDWIDFTVDSANSTINIIGETDGLTTGSPCAVRSSNSLPDGLIDNIADEIGPYYLRVVSANSMTLHSTEEDANSGDNPVVFSDNGSGDLWMLAVSEKGLRIFGSGPAAGGVNSPWNQATTWYIKKAIGTTWKESEHGESHPDDGQNAYDIDPVLEGNHIYLVTINEEMKVERFNAFDQLTDSYTIENRG